MTRLVMYTDGSELLLQKNQRIGNNRRNPDNCMSIGWGVLALHRDSIVEMHGTERIATNSPKTGYYELLAFAQAILFAESQGYAPQDVSIYTDCQYVAYSGHFLKVSNYAGERRNKIVRRLREFSKLFFAHDPLMLMRLVKWMVQAQMHWVRGHSDSKYNCRVDYLARSASWFKNPISHDEWMDLNHDTAFADAA